MEAFTIGRNEDNNYQVDNTTVSGNHLQITIGDDYKTFTLHDLNSTNGTKVDGQTILSKKIIAKSTIQLGTYELNTEDFFNKLEAYVLKNRIDFSKEFHQLKNVEANYLKRKHNTNKYFKLKSGLVKGGITIGLIIVISQLKILDNIDNGKMYLMIGVGAIGGIISTASISEKNVKHKLDDLYIDFSQEFCCPKCNFDMTSKSWKFWKSKKSCPKCKCNWTLNN